MTRWDGRTAVVSGASRGIGFAIARALVGNGARCVLLARGADALAERARELGPNANALVCDVGNAEAVQRAADAIRRDAGGAPDIIVNSAGIFALARVEAVDAASLRRTLDVNLVGPVALVRAFLPEMRARKSGHIVSIGSIADRHTHPENSAYAASKYALRAFHEVLRAELRGSGVRATLVSPAQVDTSIWDAIDPDTKPGFTPRRLMLTPDAVASAVLYALAQPDDVNVDELRLSHS
jgi:NADP-dependent 3-hydroxy acid dehydrogenase YdfG